MAKYDRAFLVPYLQDICSLHLAYNMLGTRISKTQTRIAQLRQGQTPVLPAEPSLEEEWSFTGWFLTRSSAFAAILAIVGILLNGLFDGPAGMSGFFAVGLILMLIEGVPCWLLFGQRALDAKDRNKEKMEKYEKEMEEYYRIKKILDNAHRAGLQEIPKHEKQIGFYTQEREKISRLLTKAYRANVIPSQYRDMYAAIYLYDYFSNSRSDDLDLVLNTYVLEQIKERLDRIIANQAEMILNQRMILANQQSSLEEQRAHNLYMKQKVQQLQASIEEQNQYYEMIESNTAATAYFAAASYLTNSLK